MKNERCTECARLSRAVAGAFEKVLKLMSAQLEAFRSGEEYLFARLEEAVQTAVRDKEQATKALQQHQDGHG